MNSMISQQVVLYFYLIACEFLGLAQGSDKCGPAQFPCNNGCVSVHLLCNGEDDCGDESDESECNPFNCHPQVLQCPNGNCLAHRIICSDVERPCDDESDDQNCEPFQCHPSAFQCLNGNCISRWKFCRDGDDCDDNSDELFCNKQSSVDCPPGWFQCANEEMCVPSYWVCDGFSDCQDGSDEGVCGNNIIKEVDIYYARRELITWLLNRRKSGSRTDRWGHQVHRMAIALHLADNSLLDPESRDGNEIRYELTLQLLYRLSSIFISRSKFSSEKLAMYIHAMLVVCLDTRDFYGRDLVQELRKRVEATSNYVNPFLILVLCNAGDTITAKDVERVIGPYDSQYRPFWTDFKAISSLALSCIASRDDTLVDEDILMNLLQDLKKRQFRNGTVENLRTTALVTQALLINDSYTEDFNIQSAMKVLIDGLKTSKSLLNVYYALPVLSMKSLLDVNSDHCSNEPVEEDEAIEKALEVNGETISVRYSVLMGDEINVRRTWQLRMPINSTIYDAVETVANMDNLQRVQYNVVDGKPYVASLNGKEDDPEMGTFWFIYLKALNSDEKPTFVGQSPVDIKLTTNQEIILWYKRRSSNDQSLKEKLAEFS